MNVISTVDGRRLNLDMIEWLYDRGPSGLEVHFTSGIVLVKDPKDAEAVREKFHA